MPQIRERKEDIPLLANHFLNTFIELNNISARGFDNDVYSFLQNCKWSGNVRELRNFVERSAYLCKSHTISLALLKSLDNDFEYTSAIDAPQMQNSDNNIYSNYDVYDNHTGLKEIIAEVEKEIIYQRLNLNNGNISKTARQLDLPKQTLYNKIKKYKLL